jgi:effector-binding domain-containing protein
VEHEVHVVDRPALRVVAKRLPVLIEDLGPVLSQAFSEVYTIIGAAEVGTAGPPFVIYHSMPVQGEPLDIEVCAPVAGPLEPRDPWRLEDLPAGLFASRLHVGPYDTIGDTYRAMSAWIPSNGFAVAGPPREVYLSPPSTPPSQTQTIVEFPVSRVPVAVA